jgi:hypothetical protein
MTRWIRMLPALAIVGMCLVVWGLPRGLSAGETRRLTKKDDDRREPLRVSRGDAVEVLLDFQPGNGYGWKVADDSTTLLEQVKPKEGEKVDEAGKPLAKGQSSGRPGQTEHRLFKFHIAKGPVAKGGKRDLKLILTRSGSNRAARTFTVPIEVKEPG